MTQIPFRAYDGDGPYVFICYAHDDSSVVYPELTWLREQGVNLWYDEGIAPGSEWSQEIADAIEGCDRILFFVSPLSADSEHCRQEITFAQSKGRPLCVVHLEETTLPGSLELRLSHRQAILKHQIPKAIYRDKVLAALRDGDSGSGIATPAPRRRPTWTYLGAAALVLIVVGLASAWWRTSQLEPAPHATDIAVLPFDDLSPAGDLGWLANGMAEALVVYLSRIEQLRVSEVPRTQTPDVRTLGETLGVGSVVLGSVLRSTDQLSVTARLVSVSDGTQLWSARYDRPLDDVFDVQREVAVAIVQAIETELGVEVPPVVSAAAFNEARYEARDVRAYELWRKAIDLKFGGNRPPTDEDLHQALQYNLEAVEIDPDYPMGYVGLGSTYFHLSRRSREPRDRDAARAAFARAVELDASNVIAAGNRALLAAEESDWTTAVRVVEDAVPWTGVTDVALAFPSYLMALINLGRWQDANAALDEVMTMVRRAPDRFPPDQLVYAGLARSLMILRRDDQGVIDLMRAPMAVESRFVRIAEPPLIAAYRAEGRDEEALALFLGRLPDGDRAAAAEAYADAGWQGMFRVVSDRRSERGETCATIRSRTSVSQWIAMYAELGDSERMYACLAARPYVWLMWTLREFDSYREDARFQTELERRNIVGYKTCCPFPLE